ncbi:caspase-1-like isoform X2 [Daktulosphaira vitifoliae]|uniref:caspase-1-like isoform X2 n=1 Tax=Daktulosphaira vitifoliae TaxID=58002 RepID=UPI0021AA88F3|nr:caspase-1-like isoform X2 [Daktulosphaira vitifoliae]
MHLVIYHLTYSFKSTPRQGVGISSTDKDAWYYNMRHKHRGKAIIFNHENFKVGGLKSRSGTGVDCFNLENTLKNLGFEVTLYLDSTLDDLDNAVEHWANQDYSDYDCFLMAILSHGEQGIIYAKDAPYKPEDKLWGRFTGDKCITLAGKPKLFFIQACQGDRLDGGVLLRTQVDGSQSFRIPVYADFLIAYSTIPGFYSWRNTQKGSWFMQSLCEALNKYGYSLDLLTLLTFVNRQVSTDYESNVPGNSLMHQQKQIPCITSMLTRLVKFERND